VEATAWEVLRAEPLCAPEYVAIVHPDSFDPLTDLRDGPAIMCIAARVGPVRLIDNTRLSEEIL
jgi:pantoate--beta-alanine ligase